MKDFITLALGAKKKTKAELFTELHAYLIDTHQDAPPLFRDLYNYLAPNAKRVSKNLPPFEWVALAVDLKEPRKPLQYVHVKQGWATASNGHVALSAKVDIEDGMYCPRTGQLTTEDMAQFPDIARAVSIRLGSDVVVNPTIKAGPTIEGHSARSVKVGSGAYVNERYFKMAEAIPEGIQHWELGDTNEGAKAVAKNAYAFIMPVRVEN